MLCLGAFLAFLVLPIVALVRTNGLRTEIRTMRQELDALYAQVRTLTFNTAQTAAPSPKPVVQAAVPTSPEPPVPLPVTLPLPTAAPVARSTSVEGELPVSSEAPVPMAAVVATSAGAPTSALALEEAPATSLEERIALIWFTRIGAVALLLGVAYFFKYAVDNDWIGPLGRIALGAVAGAVVLVIAEATRGRTRPVWTQITLGVGLSFLFLSAYASYGLYHLVPSGVAFVAFFVVALAGGVLSIHHRGEAILVLSLAAALAAPVLLSTGEDRPLALFVYLLVVTSLSHAAALRMEFRWALWLGVVGPAALFFGWYERFFDVVAHDARAQALYGPLSARLVPIGAVLAFSTQWLVVFSFARGKRLYLWPLALLVAATLFAHAGLAALLFEHPLQLGAVLVALGLFSTTVFQREGRPELSALPLLASFAVLAGTLGDIDRGETLAMLAVLGLWGGLYAVSFLRTRVGPVSELSLSTLVLLGGVGLAFCVLSAILLGGSRPLVFGGLLVVLSLAYCALGVASVRPWILAAAILISFGFLATHAPRWGEYHLAYIAVSAGWAAVYFGAVAYQLLGRGVKPSAELLLVLSGAGLGFVLLALAQTTEQQGSLRAALLTAVGAADLVVGAALLQRSQDNRRSATVMLGQALGLFAAAVGLFFTGATITIVWFALAAVVVWLSADQEDPLWLVGGLLLFCVAAVRLCSVDLPEPDRLRELFFATVGKQGALPGRPFFNPRAYSLVASAAACWVAARGASRVRAPRSPFLPAAGVLVTLGHVAFLSLLVLEVHQLAVSLPAAPLGVPSDEFELFVESYRSILAEHGSQLVMLTTLLMGGYAASLVAGGFGARDRVHRYLGLGLFALTLGKLALYDVWQLPRVYQILVLMGIGGLLLAASFLYARFGRRLVAILRDGVAQPLLVLLLPALLLTSSRAEAVELSRFAVRRPITSIGAPGLYRVEVDPEIRRQSRSDGSLSDLRIIGPGGEEVPFLVRDIPSAAPPVLHAATVTDPVQLADGSSSAVLDLGQSGLKHSEALLGLEGQEFFRRTRVEVSQDERTWGLLAEGAVVYRVQRAAVPTSQTLLRYPTSDARYVRITLLPGSGDTNVRVISAEVAYREAAQRPIVRAIEARRIKAEVVKNQEGARRSLWVFDLGAPGVPVTGLLLDLQGSDYERDAELAASDSLVYWTPLASAVLYQIEAGTGGTNESSTGFDFQPTPKRYLRVEVRDGDNPPLQPPTARATYHPEELVLRAATAGPHLLYVGATGMSAPAYDLPAVLSRAGAVKLETARFGAFEKNSLVAPPEAGPRPWTERNSTLLGFVLGLVLVGLSAWTVTLLRRAGGRS